MLNYANLNDVEFEYLCQDVMQKKLNTTLRRFAKGRDGGVDLADYKKEVIVQVKHYINSTVSNLLSKLKNEVAKVEKLSPKQYYVCCALNLSPQKIDEIYNLFADYMDSTANIITLNDIDDFLIDSENIEILKKHYKLWIESTGILQEIGNTNVFVDCETLLADIENEKKLFVRTSAFDSALKCLENNKVLFITGHPGVGKTITSKMLVLHYAAIGYRVRFSTNISNLDELKKSLSRNPDIKEVILVDDCFGQAYFNMKESQNVELLSLINYVNVSPNKLLILNSRITILQEAKERKPELLRCFEGKQCKVYVMDMTSISSLEKAKIFYNHISFNGMEKKYFDEIKKDKNYYRIINHANYTPRIIEFVCNPYRYRDIPPSSYFEFAIQQLDNPKEIWKDEYERRLEKVDRLLLLTLYSLSDSAVSEQKVKKCFEHRISLEPGIDTTVNQYEASLSRLLDGFIQIVSDHGTKKLAMVNPSVNDYIDGRLGSSLLERNQLVNSVCSMQQKKRLLSEHEFEGFVQSSLISHEIENYLFDNEAQKNSFITFYVCKYKVFDDTYRTYIQDFLNAPCSFCIYGNESITQVKVFHEVLRNDICKFYRIQEFLANEYTLVRILESLDFGDMVDIICLIDHFYIGSDREMFIETSSEQLRYQIEAYCGDLDADDFFPDVDRAISRSRYFNGECEEIDIDKAVEYVNDEIIMDVNFEINSSLSALPDDIKFYCDYTENLDYTIFGTEDLVTSCLEYDGYDYDDYHAHSYNYENVNVEIDYIFDRN